MTNFQVPEYKGFLRPKHHATRHLPEALLRFGPLRLFWCLPFEAFLQVLKGMFEMTNYKSAPFTVCSFWSMKTALRMLAGNPNETWFDTTVHSDEDAVLNDLSAASQSSPLVSFLRRSMVGLTGVRHLSYFQRGPVEVVLGVYILASLNNELAVGIVAEIVEAFFTGRSVIRIRLDNARTICSTDMDSEMMSGILKVAESQACIEGDTIVAVETATILELHSFLENGYYTFTY